MKHSPTFMIFQLQSAFPGTSIAYIFLMTTNKVMEGMNLSYFAYAL